METDLVDDIEFVRRLNNRLWMEILRIALASAPEATRDVLRDIQGNDKRISALLEQLCKSPDEK